MTNGSGSAGEAGEDGQEILFDGVKPVSSWFGLLVVFTISPFSVCPFNEEVSKVAGS